MAWRTSLSLGPHNNPGEIEAVVEDLSLRR